MVTECGHCDRELGIDDDTVFCGRCWLQLKDSQAELLKALKALMAATDANSRWCPACGCNVNLEHKEHYEPCSWTRARTAIKKAEA